MIDAILVCVAGPAPLAPSPDPNVRDTVVTEWEVPWGGRPRDPYVDGRGRVWFVGQAGNYVGMLEPTTGEFTRYEVDEGTNPHNLVVDRHGMVWFTGNRNGRLVRLDPSTRQLTTYPMPDASVGDPHTMLFDRDGNIWFTAQQAGAVGHMTVENGEIRLWKLGPGTRPYGIAIAPDGRVWFDLFGTNRLGMIDPNVMAVKEFVLPAATTRPRRIAITPDGEIWYGDYSRGYLGLLDPATGQVTEFELPGGQRSLPYAMAADGAGRIWLAETGPRPNRLVAFDPTQKKFTSIVESEGGPEEPNTIRHMVYDAASGAIWYGTDRGTIGKLTVGGRPKV